MSRRLVRQAVQSQVEAHEPWGTRIQVLGPEVLINPLSLETHKDSNISLQNDEIFEYFKCTVYPHFLERPSSATLGTPGHKAGAAGVVAQRHDALYAAAAAKVQERINGLADWPLENV